MKDGDEYEDGAISRPTLWYTVSLTNGGIVLSMNSTMRVRVLTSLMSFSAT